MNRSMILIVTTVLLIAAGVTTYFVLSDSSPNDQSASQQSNTTADQQTEESLPNESPLADLEQVTGQYIVRVSSIEAGAPEIPLATIEVESTTKSRTTITDAGQEFVLIIDGSTLYSYNEETGWYQFTDDSSAPEADFAQTYTLSQSQIDEIAAAAEKIRTENCGDAICDVYNTAIEGESVTVKIDTSTKRIVEIIGTEDGQTVRIVYDYNAAVQIEIPQNALDFESLLQEEFGG